MGLYGNLADFLIPSSLPYSFLYSSEVWGVYDNLDSGNGKKIPWKDCTS